MPLRRRPTRGYKTSKKYRRLTSPRYRGRCSGRHVESASKLFSLHVDTRGAKRRRAISIRPKRRVDWLPSELDLQHVQVHIFLWSIRTAGSSGSDRRTVPCTPCSDFPVHTLTPDGTEHPSYKLNAWQEKHALLSLQKVEQLHNLRFVLCPRYAPPVPSPQPTCVAQHHNHRACPSTCIAARLFGR